MCPKPTCFASLLKRQQICSPFFTCILSISVPPQGEVAFFSDGDRYDGLVEILQQHPGNFRLVLLPPKCLLLHASACFCRDMERMESLESTKNALLMLLEVSPNFLRA